MYYPRTALPYLPATCALLGLTAYCASAQANYFCVTSATEFQQALTEASTGGLYNGEDNYIDMVAGTYLTGAPSGNTAFHYASTASHYLSIRGANSPACNGQTDVALTTILDGHHQTPVLSITSPNGNVSISALTLQNGESAAAGAGLQVNYNVTPSAAVTVTGSIIRNNHSSGLGGGLYALSGSYGTYVVGSVLSGNSSDTDFGAAFLATYGTYLALYNVTAYGNNATSSATIGGVYVGGSATPLVSDSIFWNNTKYGLYLGAANAELYYNDYGTLGGTQSPAVNNTPLSVSPLFVDAANGDFHLSAASPLLGIADTAIYQASDPDGHAIPTRGKVDLGAYQDTIFSENFDAD